MLGVAPDHDIPLLLWAGFLPVLVNDRRRALQDFMAGSVVVCADLEPPAGNLRSDTPSRAATDAVQRG